MDAASSLVEGHAVKLISQFILSHNPIHNSTGKKLFFTQKLLLGTAGTEKSHYFDSVP